GILEPGAPVAADLWCLKGVFQGRLMTTAAYCGRYRFTTNIAADLRGYARGHGRDGLAKVRLPWK
ncbi:hypothetical protein M3O58_20090, partial [Xanthomonas nasturtii]